MSIYSANRTGTAGTAAVVANEAYGANSIGQILYESQVNDNAFFEAIVFSDLKECAALQEGTLLKSEIAALNEASVKDFFARVLDRIKEFWAKIKAVFADVISKILAYVLKDGKAYVAEFKKAYKGSMSKKVTIEKYFDRASVKIPTSKEIETEIKAKKNDTNDSSKKAEILAKALGATIGAGECSSKDYRKTFVEKTTKSEEKTLSEICEMLENGAKAIKGLKETEKQINKNINGFASKLKEEERKAAKDAGTTAGDIISRISLLVSVYESVVGTATAAVIGATKANLKQFRVALAAIRREAKNEDKNSNDAAVEKAVAEAAIEDADASVLSDEEKTELDTIVANAEEEINADSAEV